MNITLSIPDDVVANAREYAKRHGTSLNQMVRDHLNRFSGEALRKKRAEIAIAYFQSIVPTLPKDTKISRDEMEQR
ncbi:MAG: hypothetical protein IKS67_06955 [Victivallales bacterium]|nr:hypothetical protein [Victivallales bacterium]